MAQPKQINVRMSEREYKWIHDAAFLAEEKPSEYMRRKALELDINPLLAGYVKHFSDSTDGSRDHVIEAALCRYFAKQVGRTAAHGDEDATLIEFQDLPLMQRFQLCMEEERLLEEQRLCHVALLLRGAGREITPQMETLLKKHRLDNVQAVLVRDENAKKVAAVAEDVGTLVEV